jgi:hypothetical protein
MNNAPDVSTFDALELVWCSPEEPQGWKLDTGGGITWPDDVGPALRTP